MTRIDDGRIFKQDKQGAMPPWAHQDGHQATLDYLVERLESWGFQVGRIHGGMRPGSRDQPRTRLFVEQQFREQAIQILVATEAAGEGINLQCCHILFNYDIPWNLNRLEQRMGRIHRYGQRENMKRHCYAASPRTPRSLAASRSSAG